LRHLAVLIVQPAVYCSLQADGTYPIGRFLGAAGGGDVPLSRKRSAADWREAGRRARGSCRVRGEAVMGDAADEQRGGAWAGDQ